MTAYDDDDGGLGKVEDEVDRQIARKVPYAAHWPRIDCAALFNLRLASQQLAISRDQWRHHAKRTPSSISSYGYRENNKITKYPNVLCRPVSDKHWWILDILFRVFFCAMRHQLTVKDNQQMFPLRMFPKSSAAENACESKTASGNTEMFLKVNRQG